MTRPLVDGVASRGPPEGAAQSVRARGAWPRRRAEIQSADDTSSRSRASTRADALRSTAGNVGGPTHGPLHPRDGAERRSPDKEGSRAQRSSASRARGGGLSTDGFLISKTLSDGATWKYTWDAHGQLTEVERPDKRKVTFTYDAFGRRVTKTYDGNTTEYIWDGDDLLHERVRSAEGTTTPVTTWLFEPGAFTPLAKIQGRKRYGIVTDHLGSPTVLTTEAGRIAWRAQLDVYGVPREEEGVAQDERTDNPWRFPGQYEDPETGLYYNRFRYYDPELGRYLSEDPIGLRGGAALFGYVHEPTRWWDPLGLAGGCGPSSPFQSPTWTPRILLTWSQLDTCQAAR